MRGPVGHTHPLELLHGHGVALAARDATVEQRKGHILECVLIVDEVERLEYESYHIIAQVGRAVLREVLDEHPVQMILARVVVVEDSEYVEQGGFPGARCTHDRDKLTLLDRKVHIFQHMQRNDPRI